MLGSSSDQENPGVVAGGLLNLDPRMLQGGSNDSEEEEKCMEHRPLEGPNFENPLLESLLSKEAEQNKKIGLKMLATRIKQIAHLIYTHPFNSKYLHEDMFQSIDLIKA